MTRRAFLIGSAKIAGGVTGATAILSLTGCSVVRPKTAVLPKYTSQVALIDFLRMRWRDNIKKVVESGVAKDIDSPFSFPWYVGPNIAISAEEYEIAKYTNSDLLYPGFGLKERIGYFISQELNVNPQMAKQAVETFLQRFSTTDPEMFFVELRAICNDVPSIVTKERINDEAEKMVKFLFERYITIEEKNGGKIKNLDVFLKGLPFYFCDTKYSFTLQDYRPYALASLFVKRFGKDNDGALPAL